MFTISSVGLSIIFGFTPPLLWLLLWLQEDKDHPEPRLAILQTFALGSLMVLPAIVIERLIEPLLTNNYLLLFGSWSIIEEGLKLLAVWIAIKVFYAPVDEPIDWLIYMITAALGFAALENVLFLIEPFSQTNLLEGLVVSNLRFMGATVLHLVASAAHGAALGLCFYLGKQAKHRYYFLGFATAVIVHLAFNLFLVLGGASSVLVTMLFASVWILLLPLILIFEKLKII